MPEAGLGTVGTALEIYELAKLAKKEGWLEQLLGFFRRRHKVIVFGSSGVGKTNFIRSLHEVAPEAIRLADRTTDVPDKQLLTQIKINQRLFDVRDTPGEKYLQPSRLTTVRETLKGAAVGIINVVSYGYHEYPKGKGLGFDTRGKVKSKFLADHRALEIDYLSEWSTLRNPSTIRWIATVINKADLWWERRSEVEAFYSSGSYLNALTTSGVRSVVCPYSAVIHRFYDRENTLSDFDDTDRRALRIEFLRVMAQLSQE